MKIGSSHLLKRSFLYFFSHIQPIILVAIAVAWLLFFDFMANEYLPDLGHDHVYLYEALWVVALLVWELWIIGLVIKDLRDERVSIIEVGFSALFQTYRVWWLVVWFCILQWAGIPLLREPYCYSESVDLALYLVVAALYGVQVMLNFFQLPAIADGQYSMRKIIIDGCNNTIKSFVRLCGFFILFGMACVALVAGIALSLYIVHGLAARYFEYELLDEFFRMLLLYSAGASILAVLAIARAIVHTGTHHTN